MKTLSVKLEVPAQRVSDLLIGAFESGAHYWLESYDYHLPDATTMEWKYGDLGIDLGIEFRHGWLPLADIPMTLMVIDEGDGIPEGPYTLDRAALQRGLDVMVRKYPHHLLDALRENDDADTADVFLQCCVFGDVIFG